MLDGRIDTQGTVKDLRARGVLDDITHDESAEAHKEEQAAEAEASVDPAVEGEGGEESPATEAVKKPRKLIEEEKREEGSVKWNIYKTYLKASSVRLHCPGSASLGTQSYQQGLLDLGNIDFLDCSESGFGSRRESVDQSERRYVTSRISTHLSTRYGAMPTRIRTALSTPTHIVLSCPRNTNYRWIILMLLRILHMSTVLQLLSAYRKSDGHLLKNIHISTLAFMLRFRLVSRLSMS